MVDGVISGVDVVASGHSVVPAVGGGEEVAGGFGKWEACMGFPQMSWHGKVCMRLLRFCMLNLI